MQPLIAVGFESTVRDQTGNSIFDRLHRNAIYPEYELPTVRPKAFLEDTRELVDGRLKFCHSSFIFWNQFHPEYLSVEPPSDGCSTAE